MHSPQDSSVRGQAKERQIGLSKHRFPGYKSAELQDDWSSLRCKASGIGLIQEQDIVPLESALLARLNVAPQLERLVIYQCRTVRRSDLVRRRCKPLPPLLPNDQALHAIR